MSNKKVFSVHQPNFIPWLGYFDKINRSDIFVILDDVLIPRGTSIANKNKILSNNGIIELTFPISHPKGNNRLTSYNDILFVDEKSKQKIFKTIQSTYLKAPFYREVISFLEDVFLEDSFSKMNISYIKKVCELFKIDTEIILMSDLKTEGQKNELIVGIGKAIEGDIYLSGTGAKSYNDETYFNSNSIELVYQNYKPEHYNQFNSTEPISHLSSLDYLFNEGFKFPF
mgnify:CR=1 FL=1